MNTHLAAAAAMLGWLVVERIKGGHATTLGAASGAVAGLVAITPCAGFVSGMSPLGNRRGRGHRLLPGDPAEVQARLRRLARRHRRAPRRRHRRLADARAVRRRSVSARSVVRRGQRPAEDQLVAVGATIAFSGVVSLVLAKLVDLTIGLRVTPEQESRGAGSVPARRGRLPVRRSAPMKLITAIVKPFKLDDVKDGAAGGLASRG